MPVPARWKISGYHMDEISLVGESSLFNARLHEKWLAADARYLKQDLAGTKSALSELAAAPAAAQPMIKRLGELLEQEQALADGKWVSLEPGMDGCNCLWMSGFRWKSDGIDLPVQGCNEAGLLLHRAKIGPNFEAKGRFRSNQPEMKTIGGGLAFVHRATPAGLGYWVTAEIYRDPVSLDQGRMAILRGHAASEIPTINLAMDFGKPVEWTLQLFQDKITWTVNGRTVHQDLSLIGKTGLDKAYKAASNGRLGWSSRAMPSEAAVIFSPIEVRRLKSNPGTDRSNEAE